MTQYGQQGPGINIPRDTPTSAPPTTRPQPTGVERPAPLPPPQYQPAEPAPAPVVDPGAQRDGVDMSQYVSKAEVEKIVRELATTWDNRAARTLMRGDYQTGQRDATYTNIEELRKAFKI